MPLVTTPERLTSVNIILRSIAAGILGGLLAAAFVTLVGQNSIDAAIAIEEASVEVPGLEDDEIFSRSTQIVGGFIAAVFYGVFTGLAFGTIFSFVRHRIRVADDFRRSILLAAAAFVAMALIPAMKYPANPPAVGNPDTVNQRSILFFSLLGASILAVIATGMAFGQLRARFDQPTAVAGALVFAVAVFVLLMVVWPSNPDEINPEVPAQLIWRFRLQSLATLAISWGVLGVGLGWLLTRPTAGSGNRQSADSATA